MFTFEFNISVILSSFLIFILSYILFNFIPNIKKIIKGKQDLPLIQKKLIGVFLLIFIIISLEFAIKIIVATVQNPNIYYLQGLIALFYIFATALTIHFSIKKEKTLVFFVIAASLISIPLIILWVNSNILNGFDPFMPNYLLQKITKGVWAFAGISSSLFLRSGTKKSDDDEQSKELHFAFARLFLFFYTAQLFSVLFSVNVMDLGYVISQVVAIPSLFLIYIVAHTPFLSIEFYKKPSLFLRQRIVFRMILSLAIIIIISLELVNYATIYIVKSELKAAKQQSFTVKTSEIKRAIHDQYDEKKKDLQTYLDKFPKGSNTYYIGLSMFNNLKNIDGLQKVIMLSVNGEPLLTITPDKLNFAYSGKKKEIYNQYMDGSAETGFMYSFNNIKKLMEVTMIMYNKDNTVGNYFIAFFKSDELFDQVKSFAFDKNGEIQLYTTGYRLIYSTYFVSSFKEELNKGKYLEKTTPDTSTNINITIRQPIADAFSGLQKAQEISFFFTTLSIVLFLFIAFIYLRIIEHPIKTLQEGATIIGSGNLNHEIVIKEKNEFYELALAFNYMVKDLRKFQKEELKQEQLISITRMSVGLNHEINNPIASIMMGAQLSIKILDSFLETASDEVKNKILTLRNTSQQIFDESKKISKILKDINNIQDPIIEDYVDGTKMVKVKFD